jgi:hypothetical protein
MPTTTILPHGGQGFSGAQVRGELAGSWPRSAGTMKPSELRKRPRLSFEFQTKKVPVSVDLAAVSAALLAGEIVG